MRCNFSLPISSPTLSEDFNPCIFFHFCFPFLDPILPRFFTASHFFKTFFPFYQFCYMFSSLHFSFSFFISSQNKYVRFLFFPLYASAVLLIVPLVHPMDILLFVFFPFYATIPFFHVYLLSLLFPFLCILLILLFPSLSLHLSLVKSRLMLNITSTISVMYISVALVAMA